MRVPPCSFPPLAGAHVGRAAVVISPSSLYAAEGIETLADLLAVGVASPLSPSDLGARASYGGDDRRGTERICREDPGEGFIFV
jgi:hypothetical protein